MTLNRINALKHLGVEIHPTGINRKEIQQRINADHRCLFVKISVFKHLTKSKLILLKAMHDPLHPCSLSKCNVGNNKKR